MNKFAELWTDIAECWSESYMQYLTGALKTIELAVAATAIGCIIGLICGIIQTIPCDKSDNIVKKIILGIVKTIVRIYVEVFRGTPMIIQAIFIFYGLPYFFSGKNLDVNFAAYLVVSINTGAYMAETVRGGIMSIDRGQTEGAMSIGMNHFKTMLYVILPQTIRNIIPQIGNNLVINIKDTSVMFVIGYTELFAVHKAVAGAKYIFFPSAVITLTIYLVMTVICSLILRLWEKKMDGPENFNIATTDTLAHTSGTYSYVKKSKKEGK
ncbi:MAG: amino acid ABC transporter permease [Oscillospiraceae bacterium]|nr:amino acid ABC transporter permease [Oscillospiraceae bacterium]MDD7470403.1 amino acid ABC transporter permease [Oscillospiraceae bacterium]